jgi:signal transduction histidine kinase/ligand-binding sensor domain-containing protein
MLAFLAALAAHGAVVAYEPRFGERLLESFRWHLIPELTERGYYCMAEGPDGTMWFGVEDGVLAYDGINWQAYRPRRERQEPVLSICVANDGSVFASDAQRVWRLRGDNWLELYAVPNVREWGIYKLTCTEDGSLWIGTNYGVLELRDDTLHVYAPEVCVASLRNSALEAELHPATRLATPDHMFPVYNIEPAGSAGVLVRARDGIFRFTPDRADAADGRWEKLSDDKKLWHPLRSTVVCQSRDGAVWGLGDNGMVVRIQGELTENWDLRKLVNGDVTVSIAEAPDGGIWVGGQGSLFIYRDGTWQAYAQPEIPSGGAARITVLPASDGAVWIASEQSDVYRVDYSGKRWLKLEDLNFRTETPDHRHWFLTKDGRAVSASPTLTDWQSYGPEDGLMDAPVALFATSQDRLWAAGGHDQDAAVAYFDGAEWHRKIFDRIGWSIDYRSVFEASDGTLWFGMTANSIAEKGQRGGVLRFDPRAGDPLEDRAWQRIELPGDRASTYGIGQTADGTVWFAGSDLYPYDATTGRRVEGFEYPFPQTARIDDLCTTRDRRLWIATRNYGVTLYDGAKWRRYDAANGLLHNTIVSVYELANGNVLLATDRDVSRFDGVSWTNRAMPANFNMQREGGDFRQSGDGAVWINISSRGWKRRALDRDIYEPAKQQFWTCRHVAEHESPATTISLYEPEVSSRGNTIIAWTGADRWHVTDRDELRYSYRFDGGDWSPYTSATQRAFTSLESGDHTFEVRARDMDFNVDAKPPRIRFRVAPPLWRQPWFLGLLGLLVVAGVVSLRSYNVQRWNKALRELNLQLEDRVRQRTAELEETNREMESFAHSVSHDLRAPLRAMEGFAAALQEDYGDRLDDQGRGFVGHIVDSASRMDTLIRDLLDYSRLGRAELIVKPTSLDEVVRSALDELAGDVAAANAVVTTEPLPSVAGHRATLVRVAINLISNAIKFVRPGERPKVRIWAEPRGCDRLRLVVEDNGIGIEARHQARIFRMFERLHGVERYPGTGVGLAIVVRACERLGGSCGVDSVPGQGSRFWVELPADGMRSKVD